jgi:hypothetical protein
MPRSRSPDPQRRSESSSRHLPGNAEPISESDYFLKSAEFRVWLKEGKHKVPLESSNGDLFMPKSFLSTSMSFQAIKHGGEDTVIDWDITHIHQRYFHKFVKVRHYFVSNLCVAHHPRIKEWNRGKLDSGSYCLLLTRNLSP